MAADARHRPLWTLHAVGRRHRTANR
jgi:hypothetical protein